MAAGRFERLICLAEQVFAVRNDPSQLNVTPEVMDRLQRLHPATISEYNDGNGPAAWVLLIPTTQALMKKFLQDEISEKELFELTPAGASYDAIYLCSALVLEEFRRKGIVKQLALMAIEQIRSDHPIKALYVWPFTREGELAAEAIAQLTSLPLYKRPAGKKKTASL